MQKVIPLNETLALVTYSQEDVRRILERNDQLRAENEMLKARVADLEQSLSQAKAAA